MNKPLAESEGTELLFCKVLDTTKSCFVPQTTTKTHQCNPADCVRKEGVFGGGLFPDSGQKCVTPYIRDSWGGKAKEPCA